MRQVALFFLLLAALGAPALAQETKIVPAYPIYMEMCLESISPDIHKESAVMAAAILCECSYRNLPADGTMTEQEFLAASRSCATEAQRDGGAFTRKYLKLLSENASNL